MSTSGVGSTIVPSLNALLLVDIVAEGSLGVTTDTHNLDSPFSWTTKKVKFW